MRHDLSFAEVFVEYEISNRRVYLLYSKILGAQLGGGLGGVRLFSGSNGQGWMWLRSAKWGCAKDRRAPEPCL
jgi:hypothetical protein